MKDHFIFNEIKIKKITTNTFQKLENGDFDILIYPTTIANKMKKSSSFALNNKNYFLFLSQPRCVESVSHRHMWV